MEEKEELEYVPVDPLEEFFDVAPGSTEHLPTAPMVADTVEDMPLVAAYDDTDKSINDKFQQVYDAAINSANTTTNEIAFVEGKYKARLSETTAQMLNVALAAAQAQAHVKEHKDKLVSSSRNAKTPNSVTNNNVLVADRNQALAILRDMREKEIK